MRERLLNHLQTKNYHGFRSYNQYLHAECQNNTQAPSLSWS